MQEDRWKIWSWYLESLALALEPKSLASALALSLTSLALGSRSLVLALALSPKSLLTSLAFYKGAPGPCPCVREPMIKAWLYFPSQMLQYMTKGRLISIVFAVGSFRLTTTIAATLTCRSWTKPCSWLAFGFPAMSCVTSWRQLTGRMTIKLTSKSSRT